MNFVKKIVLLTSVILFVPFFCLTGCEYLAGVGSGMAATETLDSWEQNLLDKREELAKRYDEILLEIENAPDPNGLAFAKDKMRELQITQVSNESAITVIQQLKKPDGQGSQDGVNPLYGLIPITVAWGTNELRKRIKADKKRQADKQGRELALREIAAMNEKDITAPVVKERMYKAIGDARKGNV